MDTDETSSFFVVVTTTPTIRLLIFPTRRCPTRRCPRVVRRLCRLVDPSSHYIDRLCYRHDPGARKSRKRAQQARNFRGDAHAHLCSHHRHLLRRRRLVHVDPRVDIRPHPHRAKPRGKSFGVPREFQLRSHQPRPAVHAPRRILRYRLNHKLWRNLPPKQLPRPNRDVKHPPTPLTDFLSLPRVRLPEHDGDKVARLARPRSRARRLSPAPISHSRVDDSQRQRPLDVKPLISLWRGFTR